MAYSSIVKPGDYFNNKIYTGTGSSNALTGVGFQPDWTWIKKRSGAGSHSLFDSVRGVTKLISSNTTSAEATLSGGLTAFGTDGFTVGSDGDVNGNSATYVSWNWLAGTTSGLSGGTITPSAYSINATSGFGIYKYTGTGSAGTIAHGLGKVPKMIIVKPTSTTGPWVCYHVAIGNDKGIVLNTTAAEYSNSNWASTTPTTSVISLRAGGDVNTSSETYIAYVFCDVEGYSKIGSYTGNGNADGTFVYTGFKPAWVMFKRFDSTSNWIVFDSKRGVHNLNDNYLYPNANGAEGTSSSSGVDLLSNGFKQRNTYADANTSTGTYIYMAFAENPFVADDSGTAVPVVAG